MAIHFHVALSRRMIKQEASLSIQNFVLLETFNINIMSPSLSRILEFIWSPLMENWIKENTDGASVGTPNMATCGGIFHDHHAKHLVVFLDFLENVILFMLSL